MKKINYTLFFLLMSSKIMFAQNTETIIIDIFTTKDKVINISNNKNKKDEKNLKINYYNLDEVGDVLVELNSVFNKNASFQSNQSWIRSKQDTLRHAFYGLSLIQLYGLKEYPAMVFNHGQAAIIGSQDLETSILRFKEWQVSFDSK